MTAIIKKELRTYFVSMTGWAFLGFFVLLTGLFFGMTNVDGRAANYAGTLSQSAIFLLVLIPTLTMRLFAEEAKNRTDQLLYTSPLRVGVIVLGKFLAAYILFLIGLAITALFPVIMSRFGTLPTAAIVSAFAAYALLGACYIAIGLFISATTDNQVIAAVASFTALLAIVVMDGITEFMPADRVSSCAFLAILALGVSFLLYNGTKSKLITACFAAACAAAGAIAFALNPLLFDGVISNALGWLSVSRRFDGFSKSIFDLSAIIYYITFTCAFIYLTINTIEKRRWK